MRQLVLAAADPLDPFTHAAVAVATGRKVRMEVAVPIELETALNRLYPDRTTRRPRMPKATHRWKKMPNG